MRPVSLRVHLVVAFTVLVVVVGGLIGWESQLRTRAILKESTHTLIDAISVQVQSRMTARQQRSEISLALLTQTPEMGSLDSAMKLQSLKLLRAVLQQLPSAVSVYNGYENGDYLLLRRLNRDHDKFAAPAAAVYTLQVIERGKGEAWFLHMDADLQPVLWVDRPQALDFDPRLRPWFRDALRQQGAISTAPYTFFTSGETGFSVAQQFADGDVVVGVDLRLSDLSAMLGNLRPQPEARLALVDKTGRVLVSDQPDTHQAAAPFAVLLNGAVQPVRGAEVMVNDESWQASITPLANSSEIYLVTMLPEASVLQDAWKMLQDQLLLTAALLVLGLLLGIWFSSRLSNALVQLTNHFNAVRQFDFSEKTPVPSRITEVYRLGKSFEQLRQTISRFLDVTAHVASAGKLEELLPELLESTMEASRAEAGILYMFESDGARLHPAVARQEGAARGREGLLVLGTEAGTVHLADALRQGAPLSGHLSTKALQHSTGMQLAGEQIWHLGVPLINRQGDKLGLLLLLSNRPFDEARSRFVEYLSGFASVTLETRELIAAQKALFDSFVKLIAHAIDTKSPYTGGHCMRVPQITRLLAEAACAETEGPYADFQLTEDEWEAVELAAWLHDCGKVTTPEFVVDKATRLETLHDRIHEVRTRFEVLKREREVACWQAISNGSDRDEALATLQQQWQQLDDDFAFVAECNVGDTFMSDERLQRLQQIAAYTWTRTLSDRLGLGPDETQRLQDIPEALLPVQEPLLQDRPDHRIEHPQPITYPPELGITLQPQTLLYDRGEVKNLSVTRGTLTEEERFKINEHIIQTLIMLSKLPFPKHLRQVPEMAAGHHERMDGLGYPRNLRGGDMSVVARMLAVADIYEALTASDRPYKGAKPPEVALAIMRDMAAHGHIDPDLLALFERAGIASLYQATG